MLKEHFEYVYQRIKSPRDGILMSYYENDRDVSISSLVIEEHCAKTRFWIRSPNSVILDGFYTYEDARDVLDLFKVSEVLFH